MWLDVLDIVNMRRLIFLKRVLLSNHSIMSHLCNMYLNDPEFVALRKASNLDINWSVSKIKAITFFEFQKRIDERR